MAAAIREQVMDQARKPATVDVAAGIIQLPQESLLAQPRLAAADLEQARKPATVDVAAGIIQLPQEFLLAQPRPAAEVLRPLALAEPERAAIARAATP